jgi:hypothetical protein
VYGRGYEIIQSGGRGHEKSGAGRSGKIGCYYQKVINAQIANAIVGTIMKKNSMK